MNARFARVLSRVSLVSVVAVSALGAAACNSARSSDKSAAAASEAKAAPEGRAERAPGHRFFRQIEALDLRADQRAAVAEIEQQLGESLAPHRETARQLAEFFAAGVESGELDPEEIASHQAAIEASVAEARASFADALNDIHDTLDAKQRTTLVADLRARHEAHRRGINPDRAEHEGAVPQSPIAKLALEFGITDDQRQALREAAQKGADDLFPDRKANREAWEAKMKALGEAFIGDDFDAADHDLGSGAEDALKSFGEIATRAVQVSGKVLTSSQRGAVASMLRAHAEKI